MPLLPEPLLAGHRTFMAGRYAQEESRYRSLAHEGQAPETMVIACCDSRAAPETIFDAAPGELFVVRNVAALVPPYEPDPARHGASAAIEFAVRVLKVKRIVVIAHAGCGGVSALFNGAPPEARDFVPSWMDIAERAVGSVDPALEGDARQQAAEEACVGVTLENLMTFPWLAERVRAGELEITGMHFGVAKGCLRCRDDRGLWADAPGQ